MTSTGGTRVRPLHNGVLKSPKTVQALSLDTRTRGLGSSNSACKIADRRGWLISRNFGRGENVRFRNCLCFCELFLHKENHHDHELDP
jgi:hypothetical protein